MYESPLDTVRGLLDPEEPTPIKAFVLAGLAERDVRGALEQLRGTEAVETDRGWLRVYQQVEVKPAKVSKSKELQKVMF